MAQRDIEAIAEQMRLAEEAKRECDEAYAKAQEEEKKLEEEEFEELEDEIIDPASLGFVDSEQISCDEADEFYNEEDRAVAQLNESIDDCLQQAPVEEAEEQAMIEVDVYNEDGFGQHFASEVMKNVPGVTAVAKKVALPNGDIKVKISGSRPDLEKAFAFYVGQKSFNGLSRDDKEEFESLLVFDDGDTLAEADYREAVAHCLDPIGVNASTADLIAQDTCAISFVKEEKAKRSAKKILKALNEEDLSSLSDKDLDSLEGIQDAIQSGEGAEGMNDDELRVWKALLATMGYTPEEWDKLTPEQQQKEWKAQDDSRQQLSKSGFARWLTGIDPKTGKKFRYQNQYMDFVPYKDDEGGFHQGQRVPTQFNPDYTQEISQYQHPTTFDKKEREAAAQADKERTEKQRAEFAKKALLHSRHGKDVEGKPSITAGDFGRMLSNSSDEEVEELMASLIDYANQTAATPADAENEVKAIKAIFSGAKNKKTYIDLGNIMTGGTSGAPAVKKFINDFDDAIFLATKRASGKDGSRQSFNQLISSPAGARKLAKVLNNILNARKTGKKPMDPERALRRQDWMKMLKDLGYSPTTWEKLSTDEQLRLMDQYYASHEEQK